MTGPVISRFFLVFAVLLPLLAAGCGRSQLGLGDGGPAPDSEPPRECVVAADCDDGNPCNGSERCVDDLCRPGSPIVCDDGVDCTADTCDETSGECLYLPDHERCEIGATCDPEEGCRRRACTDASDCDDGQFCNGSEFCVDGHCEPGTPPRCDDGLECTADRCDVGRNECVHTPDDDLCDDGRFCNGVETCDETIGCRPGEPVRCDDGDPCTTDSCNEEIDRCVSQPVDNDRDGYASCGCAGPPCDCDDGDVTVNPGMREQCRDRRDNDCDGLVDCDDPDCEGDPRCGVTECLNHEDCDDGLFCNGFERCVDGICRPGTPPGCNDGIDCTVDLCEELLETCSYTPDDSRCDPGERCDPVWGCVAEGCRGDEDCDNGLYCDGAERCLDDGTCAPGPAVDCDDRVDCTEDRCDEALDRCVFIPRHERCDNGLFCDGAERCLPEAGCVPGADPCPGGDPCWDATCLEDEDRCERIPRDADGDSFAPEECGGLDCNDEDPTINPRAAEVCNDRVDNNCNGLTDCDDRACFDDPRCCEPTGPEICDDGIDNDCDGRTDCDDLRDCRRDPACCEPTGPEVCDDGIDNDCDGLTDCSDFLDCRRDPACEDCFPEICWDGEDNDCDDLVDCADPDCAWFPPCEAPDIELDCHNRLDDDLDGATDCADPDCADDPMCPEPDTCDDAYVIGGADEVTGTTFTLDNDYRPDPSAPGCAGGRGPDAVLVLDLAEPALVHLDTFGSEFDTVLYVRVEDCASGPQVACNDDTDGVQSEVIFPAEPGRYFIFLDGYGRFSMGDFVLHIELLPLDEEVCDNDRDDDGDGLIDCDDPDCEGSPECIAVPERGVAACTDGRDNDRDGLIDCDDTEDCAVVDFIGECCNGEDDNGNGVVDEFVCACDGPDDCPGRRVVCYEETFGACGPRCDTLGGDLFCDFIQPGTHCDRSGECVP